MIDIPRDGDNSSYSNDISSSGSNRTGRKYRTSLLQICCDAKGKRRFFWNFRQIHEARDASYARGYSGTDGEW